MAASWAQLCSLVTLVTASLHLGAHAVDEAQALIQTNYHLGDENPLQHLNELEQMHAEGRLHGRAAMLTQLSSEPAQRFDCSKYPGFCKAPFNCHLDAPTKGPFSPVATKGHPDFHSWCTALQYYPYMDACINKREMAKAAEIQYQWSVDQGKEKGVDELDGSYCFIEGHCTNTAVTETTTIEEAEKMCDERYGHDGWAKWFALQEPSILLAMGNKNASSTTTGFHDSRITRMFLKLACGMGNYHCDVMYCKESYCKKPYYVNKYKHLLPDTPGHLLKQHQWHKMKV